MRRRERFVQDTRLLSNPLRYGRAQLVSQFEEYSMQHTVLPHSHAATSLRIAQYLVPQHKSVHKYNDTNSKAASQPLARTYGQSISSISCDSFYCADATAR